MLRSLLQSLLPLRTLGRAREGLSEGEKLVVEMTSIVPRTKRAILNLASRITPLVAITVSMAIVTIGGILWL